METIRWDVRFAVISAFCKDLFCEVCTKDAESAPVVVPTYDALTWK